MSSRHDLHVDRLAAGLRTSGIGRGDQVLARLTGVADLAALVLACRRVGAALAVLPAALPDMALTRARAELAPALEVAVDAVTPEVLAARGGDTDPVKAVAADAPLIWQGSLAHGNPLVRCTLDLVLAQARAVADRLRLDAADHVAIRADAAHPMAVIAALAAMMAGASISDAAGDTGAAASVLVASGGGDLAEVIGGDLAEVIGGFNAELLRLVVTDGTAPQDLHGPAILTAWTMAEVGGLATLCDPVDPAETAYSTRGRRMPGVEVMIVDPVTGLDRLLLEPGEVWLRAWPRQGVSARDRARSNPGNADGFIRTGQIGMLDAEGRLILESPSAG
jgi:acyl-coenzyme A synthetase/AMP-(fatty) acid ligase